MMTTAEIRQALEADAAIIADLIYSTSLACCFTPEQPCPEWYRESVQPDKVGSLLKSEHLNWLVATQGQELVGVLAIGDKNHVKYFFTHPSYQNQGIGKQLWQFALRNGALAYPLTVRSSLFAVPVYERLGFIASESPKIFNGMHYQTMVADRG
ncbi:GNAT family N-acetyltransferase [Vogesella oryzae]|uniref:GNAT family N-acetyltransferase n=1 Tax=Vogesella oryzae TaxID=1735285 RepID=UPI001584007D|nr:GNAT family N-acetyltransferase [Vogesella oryzae]